MLPLPLDAFELARTVFAGISAVAASIKVWQETRSKEQAAQTYNQTLSDQKTSSESEEAAKEIVIIVPAEVIEALNNRTDKCFSSYLYVLRNDEIFLPQQTDDATKAVKRCICNELKRIKSLTGRIPPKWQGAWDYYECDLPNIPQESSQFRRGGSFEF